MGFIQKLFGKDKEWESKLEGVDFLLARNELARTFDMEQSIAKEEGGELYLKYEFYAVLNPFMSNPCVETYINLLKFAPPLYEVFEATKPGGYLWVLFKYLKQS